RRASYLVRERDLRRAKVILPGHEATSGHGFRPRNEMSNFGRNLALWVIIALLLVVLFNVFQPSGGRSTARQMSYSDFIGNVNAGRVRDVVIQGHIITGQ